MLSAMQGLPPRCQGANMSTIMAMQMIVTPIYTGK